MNETLENNKTIKLNFKADEPTENKRIYPKDILLQAFADAKNIPVEIGHDSDDCSINILKIIGHTNFDVDKNNNIIGEFKKINSPAWKDKFNDITLKDIPFEKLVFTSRGIGNLQVIDGITYVKEFKIISVVVLPPKEQE